MTNPIDRIQSYFDEFTKTDKDIAIYIINNPIDVITQGAEYIATQTKTSKSAVTRFSQKIGYSSFAEFKFDMGRSAVAQDSDDKNLDSINRITNKYIEYIKMIPEYVNHKQVEKAADLFIKANTVKFFGFNRSFNSANQIRQRLLRLGFSKTSIEDETVSLQDLASSMNKNDLVIIFSTTDNTKSYTNLFKEIKKPEFKTVFITCNPNLPFKKIIDQYIVLPRISKDSYGTFLDDQAIFMIFGEILIEAIALKYNN